MRYNFDTFVLRSLLPTNVHMLRRMAFRFYVPVEITVRLLLLSLHIHLAISAVIDNTKLASIFQPSGAVDTTILTSLLNMTTNSVNVTKSGHFHCSADTPWTGLPTYRPADCAWAMRGLQNMAAQFGNEQFYWPAMNSRGPGRHDYVDTPLRYKSST